MKTRNIIFGAFLSLVVSFPLCQELQAATDTPDPGAVSPFNTADGLNALGFNASGFGNSAFGWFSGWANQDGSFNTSVGAASLDLNAFNRNTAVGAAALLLSQGDDNTAVGAAALENNNADGNTAFGAFAAFANMSAAGNTAVGFSALEWVDADNMGTASGNTAVGAFALQSSFAFPTEGPGNTALGAFALNSNDVGRQNTALGFGALPANTGGFENTVVGGFSLFFSGLPAGANIVFGNDNIYIGAGVNGPFDESVTIRIGDYLAGASTQPAGTPAVFIPWILFNPSLPSIGQAIVTINPFTGQLGVTTDMSAEQQKKIEEQQASIAELKSTVAQQQKGMEVLTAQLKEQGAQIQKVSAKIEVNKPAAKVVVNKP